MWHHLAGGTQLIRERLLARPGSPSAIAIVGLGGFAGGLSRYCLTLIAPESPGAMTWTTLAINVVGSFLLPFLVVYVVEVCNAPSWVRPAIGTGFLGAFTTFSGYAWAVAIRSGVLPTAGAHGVDSASAVPTTAAAILALSAVAGIAAAAAGFRLAGSCAQRRASVRGNRPR